MGLFSKKQTDEFSSGTGEGEPKKGGFKKYLIIGIVVVVLIAAIAVPKIINKPASATEEPYSLADAQVGITDLQGNYTILAGQVAQATTNVAKAASDIASINSRISGVSTDWGPTISALQNTQQSLQSSLSILSGNITTLAGLSGNATVGNVTFNFTALNASVAALTTTANNLTSQLTLLNTKVTQLAANQTADFDEFWASFGTLNATVNNLSSISSGLSSYAIVRNIARATFLSQNVTVVSLAVYDPSGLPIVLSLYGSNLTDSATTLFPDAYNVTKQYTYGGIMTVAIVLPKSPSTILDTYVIIIGGNETKVDYATAVIGGS
jgi:hypothetical protein